MYADHFRIRCSSIHSIMASVELTHNQYWKMKKHQYRRMGQHARSPVWTVNKGGKREGPLPKTYKEELTELQRKMRYPSLPAGAKTLADTYLQGKVYRRYKSFGSQSTELGNTNEEAGFDLIAAFTDDDFMTRHPSRKYSEYIEGECDLLTPSTVIDNKCAETPFTMPLLVAKSKREHWCQIQGYCFLEKRKQGARAYTLTNWPDHMIEKEAYYKCKGKYGKEFTESQHLEALEEVRANRTYDDLPLALRVMIDYFDYDPEFIEEVKARVIWIREYIRELEDALPENVKVELRKRPGYVTKETKIKSLPEGAQKEVA